MVVGQIVREGLRFGTRYFPRTVRSIKRADVQIHKSLYGASGGKGVRHGRDIGSLGAGLYQGTRNGDDLDTFPTGKRPRDPSRKFTKTYNRYKRGRRSRCRCNYRSNFYRR